ncbi:MAG TPA: hypothetical protein VJB92_01760 [Candidatus Paceibacterota bacterium]
MDRIEKAIQKLTEKERRAVRTLLGKVSRSEFQGLDVKKLKGHDHIFRIRKGSIRIIYRVGRDGEIFLLAIERRSEKTYKDF